MTKKEAFDYLKGTKVVLQTENEQVKLQEFLFSIGYKWKTIENTDVMKLYDGDCVFFISPDGYISHCGYEDSNDRAFCDTHIYTELNLKDILGLEIDKDKEVWRGIFRDVKDTLKDVQDALKDKQIMVISKDKVLIIDL